MADRVFISFAGADRSRVEAAIQNAPTALYSIYLHDFSDAESLIREMKDHVRNSRAIIFFASKASLTSIWCKFELDLAEIETIKRGIKIYVLPLDSEIRPRDLPAWMQDYWHSLSAQRPAALERQFLNILEREITSPVFFGQKKRIDDARKLLLNHIEKHKASANVFYFTGPESTGRQSSAQGFVNDTLNNVNFSLGPLISLKDPASIEDLYVKLIEDYRGALGSDYAREVELFRSLGLNDQVGEVVKIVDAISRSGDTIYVRCRSGFFGDSGDLLDWSSNLFTRLAPLHHARLVIVANRQPREGDLNAHPNVMHSHVRDLADEDVTALVQAVTLNLAGAVHSPTKQALIAIGGNPMLAKHYASRLARFGAAAESEAWYSTIFEQRQTFLEFLGFNALSEERRKILAILSWFPKIKTSDLGEICAELKLTSFQSDIEELLLSSLLTNFGGFYSIAGPVRLVFRQMYGTDDGEIASKVGQFLAVRLDKAAPFSSDVVDMVSFLFNLEGKNLPKSIANIVSSASVLEAARELYRRGQERPGTEEYKRCVTLCDAALQATKEEALRLELELTQTRALLRMQEFDRADAIIKNLERDQSRQSLVVRAQYYRFKGQFDKAIPVYASAINSGINADAVLHEYCLCLREVGKFEEVRELIKRFERRVQRNILLLDMKASLEIGSGQYEEAGHTIEFMKKIPDRYEAASKKTAVLICRQKGDFASACTVVTKALERMQNPRANWRADLHAIRCIIYTKMGKVSEALSDATIVRSSHRRADFVYPRLQIHIMLSEGKHIEALKEFDGLKDRTRIDSALRKEILKKLALSSVLLSERDQYQREYAKSAIERDVMTEFDF